MMPDKEELYDQAVDLYADEKYDEAIELYHQALEQDPKYTDAIARADDVLPGQGRPRHRDRADQQYIEQEPEDILACTNLSMFYQKKGNDKGSGKGGRRGAAAGLEAPAQRRRGAGRSEGEAEAAMKLKDKAVLITGAGSGLGREMALVFTREGAKIGVNDLRPESAQNVVTEIERAGGKGARCGWSPTSRTARRSKRYSPISSPRSARSTSWSTTPASAACAPGSEATPHRRQERRGLAQDDRRRISTRLSTARARRSR